MFRKLAGLTAVAGLLLSGSALGAIATSAHDFSDNFALGSTGDEICVICHAPHNNKNAADSLLWNRTATTTTFVMYDSPTLDNSINAAPGATSMLCLGCHDGTIAVDSYGSVSGSTNINGSNFNSLAAFDAAMGNDHPIGIVYAAGSATGQDPELRATTFSVTFQDTSTGTIASMLQAGAVECASCHDVHNTVSAGADALLVKSNASSALCTTCHIK